MSGIGRSAASAARRTSASGGAGQQRSRATAQQPKQGSWLDGLTDFGSNAQQQQKSSHPDPTQLVNTIQSVLGDMDTGGGFGDWWQENVIENLEAADRFVQGNGDESTWVHGLTLYWDGHGSQGPAIKGTSEGSLDITDLMTAFSVLGKPLKMEPTKLIASDPKGWYEASKNWKQLFEYAFESLPEACGIDGKELLAAGLPPAIVALFEQSKNESQTSSSKKDTAPQTEQPKAEPDGAGNGGGVGTTGPGGVGGGYGQNNTATSYSSMASDPVKETQSAAGVTAGPGQVLVSTGPGQVLAVPAWKLPVKRWEGHGGLNFYLMEQYADGSTRTYIDTKGRNLGYQQCQSTEVKKGDWKRTLTREQLPDGCWAHETDWGSFLRNTK